MRYDCVSKPCYSVLHLLGQLYAHRYPLDRVSSAWIIKCNIYIYPAWISFSNAITYVQYPCLTWGHHQDNISHCQCLRLNYIPCSLIKRINYREGLAFLTSGPKFAPCRVLAQWYSGSLIDIIVPGKDGSISLATMIEFRDKWRNIKYVSKTASNTINIVRDILFVIERHMYTWITYQKIQRTTGNMMIIRQHGSQRRHK